MLMLLKLKLKTERDSENPFSMILLSIILVRYHSIFSILIPDRDSDNRFFSNNFCVCVIVHTSYYCTPSGVTRKTGHRVPEIYGWLPVIDPTFRIGTEIRTHRRE